MNKIELEIDEYVDDFIKEIDLNNIQQIRDDKVIHDCILGTNLFLKHEIAILDLPIIQRLRRIKQVDLASLVFPPANHTRFDHTLGVTILAGKIADAISKRMEREKKEKTSEQKLIHDGVVVELRLAALLHDCGHGLFSHLSEEVYKDHPELIELMDSREEFKEASPHEILSYLIVTNEKFKEFIENEVFKIWDVSCDFKRVGGMIVRLMPNQNIDGWLADIIHGAFDADKLDYIVRDSHFTGLKMPIDIDRLFNTIRIIREQNLPRRLSIDISGVSALEQILFNKTLLHSTVYHHHKIRAAECMFKSIFEIIKDKGYKINGMDFSSPVHFLRLTEDDLFSLENKPNLLKEHIKRIKNRQLLKRALVITHNTVDNKERLKQITENIEFIEDIKSIRKEIKNNLPSPLDKEIEYYDIWLDLPQSPSFKEASEIMIKIPGESPDYNPFSKIFPIDKWVSSYSSYKWKGHVFTLPEKDKRKAVAKSAKEVLRDLFGLELNKYAEILAKND